MSIELDRIKDEVEKLDSIDMKRHCKILGESLNSMREIRFSEAIPRNFSEVLEIIRMKVISLQLRNKGRIGSEIYIILLLRIETLHIRFA